MQNHLEISSKSKFWTRNVRNLSKSLTESLRKVYGIFQDLSRKAHMGPHGPIWAHMGPYRPIWTQPGPGLGPSPGWGPVRVGAHMGPYGAHMGPPGQVRT